MEEQEELVAETDPGSATDGQDVEAVAVEAAQQAVGVGEQALDEAEEAMRLLDAAQVGAVVTTRTGGGFRDKLLLLVVVVNLVLLVVFLTVPAARQALLGGPASHGGASPDSSRPPATHKPPGSEHLPEVRVGKTRFRNDQLYQQALLLSRDGDYPGAVKALERLLRGNPNLSDGYLRLIYQAMAFNLLRDGRKKEANEYADRIERMMKAHSLPEDLIKAAHRAATDGRGSDMRRNYARFLLQQDQVRPDMRDVITEAYLRIADSYKMEAEAGDAQVRVQSTKKAAEGHR